MTQRPLIESDRKVIAGKVADDGDHAVDDVIFATLDRNGRLRTDGGGPGGGGGPLQFHRIKSDGSINANVVKNTPGYFCGADLFTAESAKAWLRVYDKATEPDPSTDTPFWDGMVPGLTGGAGFVKTLEGARYCANGIAYVLVSGDADDDQTAPVAGDFTGSIQFK